MAQRGLNEYSFTFGGAGEQSVDVEGDWIQVHSSDPAGAGIRVNDGKRGTWYEGQGRRVHYERVSIYSSIAQTVVLLLGFGHASDARATANVNVDATIAAGNTLDNGGDVSCTGGATTQLLAADTARKYALIKNVSTNTITVRVGGAAVGAATGTPLEPGETLPMATTAAIFAYAPTTVVINAMSITQV